MRAELPAGISIFGRICVNVCGWLLVFVTIAGGAGCREENEPTIVIKFEPNDMAAGPAARPHDGGALALVDAGKPALAPATKSAAHATECKQSADCVVEPDDCCDCANGGRQHAIPKTKAMAAKAAREKRCKGQMCTMMLSTDPTCGKRAECVAGACVLADKKPGKK
jgi:hypothetical protein